MTLVSRPWASTVLCFSLSAWSVTKGYHRVVTLLAAADQGRREMGAAIQVKNKLECQELLERARSNLSDKEFVAAWRDRLAMCVEAAVEYAMEDEEEYLSINR